MNRLRSGLLVSSLVSLVGVALFVGCAADGSASGDFIEPTKSAEPSSPLPPSSSSSSSGGADNQGDSGTSKKDSGGADSSTPSNVVPGSPCPNVNEEVDEACGACGHHSAICLADQTGRQYWSEFSDCKGETPNGCIPGETLSEPCGNCGTRVRVCSKYCSFPEATCTGEPPSSCTPGSVDFAMGGCATNTYRQKTCKANCTYTPASLTCEAPPTSITIAPNADGVRSTIAILDSAKVMKKLTGSCPAASFGLSDTPYAYITVDNPLPKAVTTTIYNSAAPNGVALETVLAAYTGTVAPTSEDDRKVCLVGASITSDKNLTGDPKFAVMKDTNKVTIPAGTSVTIYVAARNAYSQARPEESTGPVMLNVRTDAIAP